MPGRRPYLPAAPQVPGAMWMSINFRAARMAVTCCAAPTTHQPRRRSTVRATKTSVLAWRASELAPSSFDFGSTASDGSTARGAQRRTNLVIRVKRCGNAPPSLLLALAVGALVASSAMTALGAGLPASLGHLCGHVSGASWKFSGQTGTQYNVVALPTASCGAAMKAVSGLTKQTPRSGALGAQTLTGPGGYRCAGAGIPLAHAGFCGRGAAHFTWAPRLARS